MKDKQQSLLDKRNDPDSVEEMEPPWGMHISTRTAYTLSF